jgi:hypothetical protein
MEIKLEGNTEWRLNDKEIISAFLILNLLFLDGGILVNNAKYLLPISNNTFLLLCIQIFIFINKEIGPVESDQPVVSRVLRGERRDVFLLFICYIR